MRGRMLIGKEGTYAAHRNILHVQVSKSGTCNCFQVTGQLATLKWSRGPDNVTCVNEG